MATELSEFVKEILPQVSGCPNSLVIRAIRKAADRFCSSSQVWREDIAAIDITINVDEYTISAPANTRIVGILSLMYDEQEISKKTEEWLDANDAGWRVPSVGTPYYMVNYAPDKIKLNRLPSETIVGGIIPRVILKPDRVTTVIDDLIYNDWFEAIEHGALQRLMAMPNRDWSDIQLATYHGRHFLHQIQRAKAVATKGNVIGTTIAPMRFFA